MTKTPGGRLGFSVGKYGGLTAAGYPFSSRPNSGSQEGSVMLFRRDDKGLTSSQVYGSEQNSRFGHSVDVSASVYVIGAPYADAGTADVGAIYVGRYTVADQAPTLATMNRPAGLPASSLFGHRVAIDGNLIAILAPGANRAFVCTLSANRDGCSAGAFKTSKKQRHRHLRSAHSHSNLHAENGDGFVVGT